jgi:hypothetical protein
MASRRDTNLSLQGHSSRVPGTRAQGPRDMHRLDFPTAWKLAASKLLVGCLLRRLQLLLQPAPPPSPSPPRALSLAAPCRIKRPCLLLAAWLLGCSLFAGSTVNSRNTGSAHRSPSDLHRLPVVAHCANPLAAWIGAALRNQPGSTPSTYHSLLLRCRPSASSAPNE